MKETHNRKDFWPIHPPQRAIFFLCIVSLLFLHYQSVRLVRLKKEILQYLDFQKDGQTEQSYQNLSDLRKNIQMNLSEIQEKAEMAKDYMGHLKTGVDHLSRSSALIYQLQAEINHLERLNRILLGPRARVFQSSRSPENIDDGYIISLAPYEKNNAGRDPYLYIGNGELEKNIYRGIIRFNDLPASDLANCHMLDAVLYLKQSENLDDGTGFRFEKLALFELLQDWGEGDKAPPNKAGSGEATWFDAKAGDQAWEVPGIWGGKRDVHPLPIAVSDGVSKFGRDIQVGFYFTEHGLDRLRKITTDGPNYGWLIKKEDEDINEGIYYFYSSDARNEEDRPFIEVTCLKQ